MKEEQLIKLLGLSGGPILAVLLVSIVMQLSQIREELRDQKDIMEKVLHDCHFRQHLQLQISTEEALACHQKN